MMQAVSSALRSIARSSRIDNAKKPITLVRPRPAPSLSTMPPSLPPPNPNRKSTIWSHMFGKYLIVTNTLGSGILLVVGDTVTQELEFISQQHQFDYQRSGRMFVTGLMLGPIQHMFYNLLDNIFPQNTRMVSLRKIFWDQLLMSPTYIFGFFYITSLLEGRSIEASNEEIKEKFLYTWMIDCLIWPAAQYLNFRFLKSAYRVAFINMSNCLYIVLLSYIKHDLGVQHHQNHQKSSKSKFNESDQRQK